MIISILFIPTFFIILLILMYFLTKNNNKPIKKPTPNFSYIDNYEFPPMVISKFKQKYPNLIDSQINIVKIALKDFFKIYKSNKNIKFGMPSEAVDELWHSFILDSEEYEKFCSNAFGRKLHHKIENENVEMRDLREVKVHSDLINTFKYATKLRLTKSVTYGLPLIFAIDMMLNIPNGYYYDLDNMNSQIATKESSGSGCSTSISNSNCGSSSSCSSHSSSSSSSSCGSSSSSCGSGSSCGGGGD